MSRILILGAAVTFLLGGAASPTLAAADDYDVYCAVILCLAAGFPAEPSGIVGAAYGYMIDWITDWPPKPPFGTCSMNDGAAYDAADVMFVRPSPRSRDDWICPEPAPMAFDPPRTMPSPRRPAILTPNMRRHCSSGSNTNGLRY